MGLRDTWGGRPITLQTGARPSRGRSCGCRTPTSRRRGRSGGGPPTAGAHDRAVGRVPVRVADVEPAEDRFGAVPVAGEHRRAEAVVGVVHPRNRLVVVATIARPITGPNDSSRMSAMRVVDVDDDGRLEPVARSIDAMTTGEHARALAARVGDLCVEHVELLAARASGPTSVPSSLGITDAVAAHDFDERRRRTGPRYCVVHIDAFGRAARLPGVVERTFGDIDGGTFDVDVVARRRPRPCRPARAARRIIWSAAARATLLAGRVRTGEAHHVDVRCRRARRRSPPAPTTACTTSTGTPARCSRSTMPEPGEGRVL